MPSPTAITSNGQHNTSTFAIAASSKPSCHTKSAPTDWAGPAPPPPYPAVAAPDAAQTPLACPSRSHDPPRSTSEPAPTIARPTFPLPLLPDLVCSVINPPASHIVFARP